MWRIQQDIVVLARAHSSQRGKVRHQEGAESGAEADAHGGCCKRASSPCVTMGRSPLPKGTAGGYGAEASHDGERDDREPPDIEGCEQQQREEQAYDAATEDGAPWVARYRADDVSQRQTDERYEVHRV